MRLLMHILRENKKENIDNTTLSIAGMIYKLREEQREVTVALINYSRDKTLDNLKEVIREAFDVIQVCILIIWRAHRKALKLGEPNLVKDINIEHKNKLVGREWIIHTGIEIDIKE